jgi:hypothetical protein
METNEIKITIGRKLFEFTSMQQWINNARSWFASSGYSSMGRQSMTICLDTKGRICQIGGDFQRAHDDSGYPISVYVIRHETEADIERARDRAVEMVNQMMEEMEG